MLERFVPVDGCHNVRDLGGYVAQDGRVVRWRRLFRADGPNDMTPAGREAFASLGIHTVIDLRSASEHGESPFLHGAMSLPVADVPNVDWSENALKNTDDLANRYYGMTIAAGLSLRVVFAVMADRLERPLMFHCAAGKDRTGITAALTLSLLGVPDDVIAADYGLSHDATDRRRRELMAKSEEVAARYGELAPITLTALPATMHTFLGLVHERHGDARSLLETIGVSGSECDRIVDQLLVESGMAEAQAL